MSWTRLIAKKAREEMGRDAEYDFDPADIARQVADEFPDTDVLASPPPLRPGNVAVDTSQPSALLEQKEEELPRPKRQGRGPSKRNLPVSTPVAIPEDAESLVLPNGITGEVALGVRFSTEEFYPDFPGERMWRTGKLNIKDRCTNAFLKKNWEAWRKLAQPPYVPPKAEVRKSFLHYVGLELHGLKVDWSTVDLSIAMNTILKDRRHAARHELYRLRARMDGRLVKPTDPDADEKSQKVMKRLASTQDRAPKRPRSEPKPKVSGKDGNIPSCFTTCSDTAFSSGRYACGRNFKERQGESYRISYMVICGYIGGGRTNQMSAADFTTQVKQDCSNIPCEGQMTQSMSNMASTLTMAMEEHTRVWKFWASLEDQLAQAKKEEDVLKHRPQHVDQDELESGRGRHVLRNDVDILINNELRTFALLEVNKALNLWRADNVLPGVSFVREHRTSVKLAGLDADDFNMEKLLGTKVPKTPDDVGPDFEESLNEHARLKLKSDLLAIVDGPPRVTRSTRTRLEYEPIVVSTPAFIPSSSPSIPIDLTNAGLDDPFSPSRSQIVSVHTFVDLAQYISSPENQGSKDQGWLSKCDLTKEDLESGLLPCKHLRGDVINVYIKERFLDRGCDKMHNMFFVNTLWFPKASNLVNKYDKTSHSEETMISIARLPKSISPKLHDGDSQGQLPAWIFVPIHGSNHWSLAIIRLHREYCHIVHLDSCVDIHSPTAIFHVLKTFISLTMKVDVTKIEHQSWPVDQKKDNFSCGIHVLQMLVGACMREADLDRCFWQESFNSIATIDHVTSFWLMLGLYLGGKLKVSPT
ncbi:hypothetical protein R1sor_014515 [Riccia sorocarpa]|uniref:Ubiquitin-like protease family profile domain-containing protein n=1 Tax=Riccia sorocarpa TaxID=122646 RepID=A0ABD3HBG0_9MARC